MKMEMSQLYSRSKTGPIVVQFHADWCAPCQVLKPVMKDLASQSDGKWEMEFVNIEDEQLLAHQFQIRSIPAVVMLHDEKEIARFTGSKSRHIVENWLDNNLPAAQYKGEFEDIDEYLRTGQIQNAKNSIIDRLIRKYDSEPLLQLLKSIENLRNNNKEAKNTIEQMDRESPIGVLIKKIRDLIDIDEDEKDVHTPSSSPYTPKAKDVHQKIDIRNIDIDLLNDLVHLGINEVRRSNGISDLSPDPILDNAARDQTDYMIRFDQLSHYQNDPAKKTVRDRILSFGGHYFRAMGENVQYHGFPVRTYSGRKEVMASSYINAAENLIKNWVKSPGHYRNLISADFKYVGTSVGWNVENASLFATQVFGA